MLRVVFTVVLSGLVLAAWPLLAAADSPDTVRPAVDFSGVQTNLAGAPTRILTLGTWHLAQLEDDVFPIERLSPLLDRLEVFAPDIIAIESMPGRACDELRRYDAIYPDVWDRYCFSPDPALASLAMTQPEAEVALWKMLNEKPEAWRDGQRRRLATLFWATGNPYSAAVQWRSLMADERRVGDGVNEALVALFDTRTATRGEANTLGAALAARLGHDQIFPMDDHTADLINLRAPQDPYAVLGEHVWSNMPEASEANYAAGTALLEEDGRVLDAYRHLNSARSQALTIDADFGAAAAHNAITRQYVSWWQTRGLRMAANVIEAAAHRPGATVLVIVGASHKDYFDAYLDQMHDIELVSIDEVL
ncbi:MAG: DUF5694 domain-containing protein [Pseudomonadota bacterium]